MTEKLFYEDSHIKEFTAMVLECLPQKDGFLVRLDRTAFFPEGGGQYADTGTLQVLPCGEDQQMSSESCGEIPDGEVVPDLCADHEEAERAKSCGKMICRVTDVQETAGEIWHSTDKAPEVGSTVKGKLDWTQRFMKMQQHSGEHIVSGLVHAKFGYDNVGFHLGNEDCTMDFNGEITKEQLQKIEWEANEVVVKNLDLVVSYPSKEELRQIPYRSKIEIEGQVRLVTIPGVDICACCAPHVRKTGEIGLIKLTDIQRYKGGVRITMLCGVRALADYEQKALASRQISAALCAREEEIADAVEHLKEECAQLKLKIARRQKELLAYKAKEASGQDWVCLFENDLEGEDARFLMNLVLEQEHEVCAVFCGNDQQGYRYVIGSREMDMRVFARELNAGFEGRGGGRPEMVQGAVKGEEGRLRAWFREKAGYEK